MQVPSQKVCEHSIGKYHTNSGIRHQVTDSLQKWREKKCVFNKTNSCHYKHDQNAITINQSVATSAQSVDTVSAPPVQSSSTRAWTDQDMAMMKEVLVKLNHNMVNVMSRIESLEKMDFPRQETAQGSQ